MSGTHTGQDLDAFGYDAPAPGDATHRAVTHLRSTWQHQDGAALLDDVEAFYNRFVVYPGEHERVAHVLWTAHAHRMDLWDSTPRLAFMSPEPGSGKSRALEVTAALVPRPLHAVNATVPYLIRKIADPDGAPTLLYDEIDTVFGPKARDASEDLRGVLNAGHRRGAVSGRCRIVGKTVEPEELPAYCAVALAGLHDLPDTIRTRSVVVRMRRRRPDERAEPWRARDGEAAATPLRTRLEAWAVTLPERITRWPTMPDGVEDRDADVWEALLTVADHAGGNWPHRARQAATALVAASRTVAVTSGVRLLADLRDLFTQGGHDKLLTTDVTDHLNALEEAPWSAYSNGKGVGPRDLARLLAPYGVSSRSVRDGERTGKGYRATDLADPWARYLPEDGRPPARETGAADPVGPGSSVTRVTTSQPRDTAGLVVVTGESVTAQGSHRHNHPGRGPGTTTTPEAPPGSDTFDTSDTPTQGEGVGPASATAASPVCRVCHGPRTPYPGDGGTHPTCRPTAPHPAPGHHHPPAGVEHVFGTAATALADPAATLVADTEQEGPR